jgi:HSP20 family protein
MAAEIKTTPQPVVKEYKPRYRVRPRYGIKTGQKTITLQIALPGVKKEDIEIEALKDYFTLRATREEIQYALDLDFNLEIEPEHTHAKYEEGLLTIEFKRYNPREHAISIKIE